MPPKDLRPLDLYKQLQPFIQKEASDIAQRMFDQKMENYKFHSFQTPEHFHNGIDSPPIVDQSVSYIGFVPYQAPYDTTTSLQFALPGGWSARHDSTGFYTVVHNLGNTSNGNFYSFVCNATQSTNEVVSPVVSMFANEVSIGWFKPSGMGGFTATDTSFCFILCTGNNRVPFRPQYQTANMTF